VVRSTIPGVASAAGWAEAAGAAAGAEAAGFWRTMNTMASSNPSGEKPCAHAILSGAAASFNTAPRQINTIDEASVPAPPTFSASAAAISLTGHSQWPHRPQQLSFQVPCWR